MSPVLIERIIDDTDGDDGEEGNWAWTCGRFECFEGLLVRFPFRLVTFDTVSRHFLDVFTDLTFRVDLIFESFLLLYVVISKYELDYRPPLLEVNTTIDIIII